MAPKATAAPQPAGMARAIPSTPTQKDCQSTEATIRQRYGRSIRNLFNLYMPIVTGWKVYDNSATGRPQLLAEGKRGQAEVVFDAERWSSVRGSAANG